MRAALLLMALLVSGSAAAAPKKKAAEPAPEPEEFAVEIPRSELSLSQEAPRPIPAREQVLELTASSWEPRSLTRSSYSGARSRLARGKLPLLSVSAGLPVWSLGGLELQARAGLGYARLSRSGPALAPNAVGEARQHLNLFLLRAGLELRGPGLLGGTVEPFLGLSALPAALMGPASQYESDVSVSGLGFEGEAGLRVFPGFLTGFLGGGQGSVALGAHYTTGDLGGSSLRGVGGFLGVGVTL